MEYIVDNGQITIDNTADSPFLAITLYGKSICNGAPTPETPATIVSVGDDGSVELVSNETQATITSGLPLCSIDNLCDELVYNADGTGKIIKRVCYIVLDGSEPYTYADGYFYTPHVVYGSKNSTSLCSHFPSGFAQDNAYFSGDGGFGFYYSQCTSVDEWTTYLAGQYANGTPVTLITELADVQEIELSDVEMEALSQLRTSNGGSTIYNDAGAEMIISVVVNGVSKVIFGDRVLIDLTNDTVKPEVLLKGYTAHTSGGAEIVGVLDAESLQAENAALKARIAELEAMFKYVILDSNADPILDSSAP